MNYSKIKISKSDKVFTQKATEKEIQELEFRQCEFTQEELYKHIEEGKSFSSATFVNNHRSGKNFKSQQILAVDIDKDLSLSQIECICKNYGIMYNFAYPTFRHTEEFPRYRVVFVLDGEIQSRTLIEAVNRLMLKLFDNKADKQCIDSARFWQGTDKKIICGNEYQRLNLINLIDSLNYKLYQKDKNQVRSCFHSNNIVKHNNCVNGRSPIIYTISDSYVSTKKFTSNDNLVGKPKIEKWDINDLLQFEIFRRFYNGEGSGFPDKLDHWELFGIATNLYPLSGGIKLYKDCINKNPKYNDKHGIINYVGSYGLFPMHLAKFSPYENDIKICYNTFPQAVKKKGKVVVYDVPETHTIEEVYPKFEAAFEKIKNEKSNKVHAVLVAPGMGKSCMVRNMEGCVLAFPNHKLKEEHYRNSLLSNSQKIETPDIRNRFLPETEAYIELLYSSGDRDKVNVVLRNLAKGKNFDGRGKCSQTECDAAKDYLKGIEEIKKLIKVSPFTTHIRGLQMSWEGYDTIVFDENPLDSIFEVHQITKSNLSTIFLEVMGNMDADKFISLIQEESFEHPKITPRFNFASDVLRICRAKKLKGKVTKFFDSEFYWIKGENIYFLINNVTKLSADKKYIICDATASVSVLKHLFKDRLEITDLRNVKNKGKIIQYTALNYSKNGFKKYGHNLPIGLDISLPTITFKSTKAYIPNSLPDIHLGACRGTNVLEGLPFNSVGTLSYHEAYYRLLSATLDLGVLDFAMSNQLVNYDGRQFMFATFNDKTLQRIHLEMVEAELLQSVHRARLIRHPVTVTLWSGFPLAQAEYIW